MNLKYKSFGARAIFCQQNRIDKGFQELGLIESDSPDFIYSNDEGTHQQAINFKRNFAPNAKLILGVLDVPSHLPDYNIDNLIASLKQADAITSISEYTQKCVKEYCGFESTVVYQPINNIYKATPIDNFKCKLLLLGRFRDPNKRSQLVLDAFRTLGYDLNRDVIAVGPDTGIIVPEEFLNNFYNGAEYVCCSAMKEGLLLPAIEAVAANKIPLILRDLTTREELFPTNLFPEYSEISPNSLDISNFISKLENDLSYKEKFKERLYGHYKINLEDKFKPISVAKKIVEVYENIK